MKCNRRLYAGCIIATVSLSAAILSSCRAGSRSNQLYETNNPQKFYLSATGSSFSYTFTCDPRAADGWLFRSAGGTMFIFQPPGGAVQAMTNTATAK